MGRGGGRDAVQLALDAHHRQYDGGVVLDAGTTVMSPAALVAYDAVAASRPSMGWPGQKFAHVFGIDPGDARVFARATGVDQPVCG